MFHIRKRYINKIFVQILCPEKEETDNIKTDNILKQLILEELKKIHKETRLEGCVLYYEKNRLYINTSEKTVIYCFNCLKILQLYFGDHRKARQY